MKIPRWIERFGASIARHPKEWGYGILAVIGLALLAYLGVKVL